MIDRKELVGKMCAAESRAWSSCEDEPNKIRDGMDAALSVAVDELLGEPTQEEVGSTWVSPPTVQRHVANIFAFRRAQLERVKTPEERVTVIPTNISSYSNVLLDGNSVGPGSMRNDQAEIYRLGLIQQLKGSA